MSTERFTILKKQPQLSKLMHSVVANSKLGHAYVFEGMRGAGQLEMALYIAAMVFCETADDQPKPCGDCLHCQRVLNGDFPDVGCIKPEGDSIKIDQIRELKQALSLSALEADSKVFIIEEADLMTVSAANSLLKFLEEPNPGVYIFLLTTRREAILPTIQSRAQMIHFPPLNQIQLQGAFQEAGINVNMSRVLSEMTNDIDYGLALSQDEVFNAQLKISLTWLENILKTDPRAFTMVATDWMKITKERRDSLRGLDLILFHVRDLLYCVLQDGQNSISTAQLIFPQYVTRYQTSLAYTNTGRLIEATELINKAQKMINSNVNVQAAYEYLVLAIWQNETAQ